MNCIIGGGVINHWLGLPSYLATRQASADQTRPSQTRGIYAPAPVTPVASTAVADIGVCSYLPGGRAPMAFIHPPSTPTLFTLSTYRSLY